MLVSKNLNLIAMIYAKLKIYIKKEKKIFIILPIKYSFIIILKMVKK